MNLEVLYHPSPLLIPVVLVAFLVVRCVYCRQWPEMDKLVQIIAYGAGIYAASAMLLRAFTMEGDNPGMPLALFTGAAVTLLASVRGAWVVFSSISRRVIPKANGNNYTQTEVGCPENQEESNDLTLNKND